MGSRSQAGSLVPVTEAREVTVGKETEERGKRKKERACICRGKENAERGREERRGQRDQNAWIILGRVSEGREVQPQGWKIQGRGQGVPGRD